MRYRTKRELSLIGEVIAIAAIYCGVMMVSLGGTLLIYAHLISMAQDPPEPFAITLSERAP